MHRAIACFRASNHRVAKKHFAKLLLLVETAEKARAVIHCAKKMFRVFWVFSTTPLFSEALNQTDRPGPPDPVPGRSIWLATHAASNRRRQTHASLDALEALACLHVRLTIRRTRRDICVRSMHPDRKRTDLRCNSTDAVPSSTSYKLEQLRPCLLFSVCF